MMDTLLLTATIGLVVVAVLHLLPALHFSYVVVNRLPAPPVDDSLPRATVILSVRGCDPSLGKTLRHLLEQRYPDYRLIVVVDHVSDSAWGVVHDVKREYDIDGRMDVMALENPRISCGLKCSAVVQAVESIDDQTDMVVLVDADVITHPTWLAEAVAPLSDPVIGIVTGSQWFEPEDTNFGSALRSLWNAGALVSTAELANPWAGTCAMRLDDIRRYGLVDAWNRSIIDDGPIREIFNAQGLSTCFHPNLIAINREACTTAFVWRYVARMLTWSRLYESTFAGTFLHMTLTASLLMMTVTLSLVALLLGRWDGFFLGCVGLVLNSVFMVASYSIVRTGVVTVVKRRGEIWARVSAARIAILALLMPLCQLLYAICAVRAVVARHLSWRQVTYEFRGKAGVRMVEYRPMNSDGNNDRETSV